MPPTIWAERAALSPAEFANALGVSRMHIYNLMNRGELRSTSVGRARRIPITELERLLAPPSGGAA